MRQLRFGNSVCSLAERQAGNLHHDRADRSEPSGVSRR